jgi:predicted MPP superfamily phosphohydrolase
MGAPIVPSRYRQRYVAGVVREGDRTMFVTSGVGTSVLPVRLGVPPEIAVLTLKGKDEAASKTPAP